MKNVDKHYSEVLNNDASIKVLHTKRKLCRLCNSKELSQVLPLAPIPIGEKYYQNKLDNEDARFPIDLYQCSTCLAVQTSDDIDNDYLWSNYTYFSGQSSGIIQHQAGFADRISRDINFDSHPLVIDIGSNDGTLLKSFKDKGFRVYGVDPAETVAEVAINQGIETHIGLFSDEIIRYFPEEYKHADLITAFNVFAHSDNMKGMIDGVRELLKPEGIFCFEVQYLVPILDKFLLGTIFHEHMIHYSVTSANNFLQQHGLKLIDLEQNNIQKGSIIFYAVKKENPLNSKPIVNNMLEMEKSKGYLDGSKFNEFQSCIDKTSQFVADLKEKSSEEGKIIAAFGAARSGPTLAIQFGFENVFSYIMDDHPSKCGKFAAFENLEVKPSSDLLNLNPDYVVILAWIHTKTIISKNLEYLNQGGTFVTLWPEYKEVTSVNYADWLEID